MKTFELEKNIPISKIEYKKEHKHKYPFESMQIMDSFFIPCKHIECEKVRNAVTGSLVYHNAVNSTKYRVMTRWNSSDGGVRVWRVA